MAKTRATIDGEITSDLLTGSAGNITAAKLRSKLQDLNNGKANIIIAALDCSSNPNYPASERGDQIPVSVAGRVGGAAGLFVSIGDVILCLADSAAGTHAAVGANFVIARSVREYVKADATETNEFQYFKGQMIVLTTIETDWKTTFDEEITIPSGLRFYPIEVGAIATTIDTPTNHPTIRFGINGSLAALLAATALTNCNAVGERERFTSLVSFNGCTTLTAGVTVAATGTTWKGRFYFTGFLMEDE